jgi:hypothetical protein
LTFVEVVFFFTTLGVNLFGGVLYKAALPHFRSGKEFQSSEENSPQSNVS